jgi:hypothetical protein
MKKQRKGFSIIVETKNDIARNTIYFEEKAGGRVIYCNIYDEYLDTTFQTKAVCHEQDEFSKKKGYELAFKRCKDKRYNEYNKISRETIKAIDSMKRKEIQIEYKFTKFLENIE